MLDSREPAPERKDSDTTSSSSSSSSSTGGLDGSPDADPPCVPEVEPNDSAANATALASSSVCGTIAPSEVDILRFEGTKRDGFVVTLNFTDGIAVTVQPAGGAAPPLINMESGRKETLPASAEYLVTVRAKETAPPGAGSWRITLRVDAR